MGTGDGELSPSLGSTPFQKGESSFINEMIVSGLGPFITFTTLL